MMENLFEKICGAIEINPFSKMCKMEVIEASEGYVKGRMPLQEDFMNPYQGMHGGCLYALADTIAGLAAVTYGNYVTTIDGHLNYLNAAKDTEYVYCIAKVKRAGNKIIVCDAELLGDHDQCFCLGDFNYYRLDKEI